MASKVSIYFEGLTVPRLLATYNNAKSEEINMDWTSLIIGAIGAVTGTIALVWHIKNDLRKLEIVFLGSRILLINHTRRPVNIDAVGFEYQDGTSSSIFEPSFQSICTIPAEDQKDIDIGNVKLAHNAKNAFARDVLGKTYRRKIKQSEIEWFMESVAGE